MSAPPTTPQALSNLIKRMEWFADRAEDKAKTAALRIITSKSNMMVKSEVERVVHVALAEKAVWERALLWLRQFKRLQNL